MKTTARGSLAHHQPFEDTVPAGGRALWMPWIGGTRPNTTVEEALFVMRLGHLADRQKGEHRRSDITAVLNALRCGLLVDELIERAPGLDVARLYGAYHDLDGRRRRAEAAWTAIVDDPCVEALHRYGIEAGKLVPSLICHLLSVAETSPRLLGAAVQQSASAVRESRACVNAIEHSMQQHAGDTERREGLRRLLYDPEGEGATGRPDFLARRVGTLVPARVAALLGEHVDIRPLDPTGGASVIEGRRG